MTKQDILCAGRILGRYELLLPVAKGGMAEVWAARLLGTRGASKIVAVKTISRTTLDDARLERMFREEASLASRIQHPNVVKTLELGEYAGVLFLAMEWVDGEPLNVVLAQASTQGGIPLDIAVNIVGQACLGLHAAHEARDENGMLLGVVHRDVSPQNVLVSDSGAVKLVDFGIAKATLRTSALTAAGEIKGKFAYMSPEQVSGRDVDRRSDVFSLGVLLFMLTTGRHPFRGEHPGETVRRLYSQEPAVAPSRFMTGYPPALEAVVLQALAKPVDQRWESASDLRAALELAMPSAFEGKAEVRLSRYMQGLMGAQLAERRKRLRCAEEAVAERYSENAAQEAAPRSQGSLRGFCLEQSSTKPNTEVAPPEAPAPQPSEVRVDNGHNVVSSAPVVVARPSWRHNLFTSTTTLLLGVALTLGYQRLIAPPESQVPQPAWGEHASDLPANVAAAPPVVEPVLPIVVAPVPATPSARTTAVNTLRPQPAAGSSQPSQPAPAPPPAAPSARPPSPGSLAAAASASLRSQPLTSKSPAGAVRSSGRSKSVSTCAGGKSCTSSSNPR